VLRAGCAWSLLPKDFPPHSTVYDWFLRFRREGLFEAINHHLVMQDRERSGARLPLGGGGRQPVGQDGRGRRAEGLRCRKEDQRPKAPRHGRYRRRALAIQAHPADIQDRDGAIPLLKASRRSFPFVELAFADSAYNAERVREASVIAIEVVKKIADQVGFQVLPAQALGGRTLLRLDQSQPTAG
jgi:transposase